VVMAILGLLPPSKIGNFLGFTKPLDARDLVVALLLKPTSRRPGPLIRVGHLRPSKLLQ